MCSCFCYIIPCNIITSCFFIIYCCICFFSCYWCKRRSPSHKSISRSICLIIISFTIWHSSIQIWFYNRLFSIWCFIFPCNTITSCLFTVSCHIFRISCYRNYSWSPSRKCISRSICLIIISFTTWCFTI